MRQNEYTRAAEALRVIAHPQRLKILELLQDGELSVSDIQADLGIKQSITSQHLNNMKNKAILKSQRRGNSVFYHIINKDILKVITCIKGCQEK